MIMTDVFIASDLHIDWHRDRGAGLIKSFPDADIGVFAGDLCEHSMLNETLARLSDKYPDVIYVSGNHEYYNSDWMNTENIIRVSVTQLGNVHWLNDSRVTVGGHSFIGSTLWFPKTVAGSINKKYLNDFKMINNFEPEVYDRHDASVKYLEDNIQKDDIVVTHHMPSFKSVPAKFKTSILNCFFVVKLDHIITKTKSRMWIHGHTHSCCDYMHGYTHVYCNPHGYPNENPFFNSTIIKL